MEDFTGELDCELESLVIYKHIHLCSKVSIQDFDFIIHTDPKTGC